jgi:uncharacterized repeat protein (TIGR01451 family)
VFDHREHQQLPIGYHLRDHDRTESLARVRHNPRQNQGLPHLLASDAGKPDFMKRRILPALLSLVILLLSFPGTDSRSANRTSPLQAPILKWQAGGCYASWCETGWYSSPAVVDLEGDGTMEVIGAAYSVFILNGEDGTLQQAIDPPGSRVWPGIVVVDLDADGDPEIATASGGGYITVFDHTGTQVWSERPADNELRGLSAFDLDDDGTAEIVVTGAVYERTNTWVYEHDGTLRSGWPQLSNDSGYAHGVFNDNAAVADLDGDGEGEIIVPSDVHYICAYESGGNQILAHPMYGDKAWGRVGVHVDHEVDLRGWANCGSEHRPNFAHTPAIVVDVDGDGVLEAVVMGNVYNCGTSPYTSLYEMPFIFRADRSRWSGDGYNWTAIPVPDAVAAPLSEDWHVVESNMSNPVAADLDGDGNLELVYASYDGRVHAYWLDKTEHGDWPHAVHTGGPIRFASEPVIADLDDDGLAEVIFGSWVQKGTHQTGKLHILDYQGRPLHEVGLPSSFGSPDWNGALAAPTLANIDGDSDLEVVLNTAHSGLVAYDLPGTSSAHILWGTGRGNYQRTGALLQATLEDSSKSVRPVLTGPGGVLSYTITLRNPGPGLPSARVTDTLPTAVRYLDDLSASCGGYGEAGGVITWTGMVPAATPVTITFSAMVREQITVPLVIVNVAQLDDGQGNLIERQALAIASARIDYLPLIRRH